MNSKGVQGDCLNSSASNSIIEPDFIWDSAGKRTDFGFQVEARIPFKTIPFKSGKDIEMRLIFVRAVSRTGGIAFWPKVEVGNSDFNSTIKVIFEDVKPGLKLEVLPNFTYSSEKGKVSQGEWGDSDNSPNLGTAIKYGVTSSITAELTVNPDFSQVESDTYQVEVNQRYPEFRAEKRPFFMEGAKTFDFGLTIQNHRQIGMLTAAINTRSIVDPGWAAKVSGNVGKLTFSLLSANDRAPEQTWGDLIAEDSDKEAYWGIARGKYNLGSDNSIGLLYSGSFYGESKNNTLGLDLQYRPFKKLRLFLTYLHTMTKLAPQTENVVGGGFTALALYENREINSWALYERYDEDFNMNSAFLHRTGISRGKFEFGYNIYNDIKGLRWAKRFQPFIAVHRMKDLTNGLFDQEYHYGFRLYMARQAIVELSHHNVREGWQGQLFDKKFFHFYVYGQMTRWMLTQIFLWTGDQIFYSLDPYLGTGPRGLVELTLEPFSILKINFDWSFGRFYRKS
ncbi:MAG: hypothetical protein GY757_01790, partial [bacterium]|nr:hypothetical protein [bacterium]